MQFLAEPKHAIQVRAYRPAAVDAHGNVTASYDLPRTEMVFAIYQTQSVEPDSDRESVITERRILAPPVVSIGPRDRIEIDGLTFEVTGEPADWTQGPFTFTPGIEFRLRKVDG